MDDSSSDKKPAIPAWQRAQAPPSESTSSDTEASRPPTPSSDSDTNSADEPADELQSQSEPQPSQQPADEPQTDAKVLLQQARKFLQDPSIRDAPEDRKRSFLRSKGVTDDDIQLLLADDKAKDTPPSTVAPPKSTTQQASPAPAVTPRAATRDMPPIVTYPEFLTQPTSPPPLITVSRVLNAIYAAAGLGAVTYGISNYLIKPLTEELTGARAEFAVHTKSHMETLNEKLEGLVSTVPKHGSSGKSLLAEQDKEAASDEDSDEDPTELYHRDYGTQTSPDLSRRASVASSSDPDASETPTTPVEAQSTQVHNLTKELRGLTYMMRGNSTQDEAVGTQLADLRKYLNEMAYSSPYFSGDYYGNRYGQTKKPGEDDAVEAFKADIRSVKGVFLSSRNFPSAQQRGYGMGR